MGWLGDGQVFPTIREEIVRRSWTVFPSLITGDCRGRADVQRTFWSSARVWTECSIFVVGGVNAVFAVSDEWLVIRNSLLANQICSLKVSCAALEAALAAAIWTVLLDMTPVANSCWAFSKLAPVVRYIPCTWWERKMNTKLGRLKYATDEWSFLVSSKTVACLLYPFKHDEWQGC